MRQQKLAIQFLSPWKRWNDPLGRTSAIIILVLIILVAAVAVVYRKRNRKAF